MSSLGNLDLLSVGVAIAASAILGFIVFLSNKKSVTNRTLFFFTIESIFWNIFNYLIFQFSTPEKALIILRFHVFFVVWYCFLLFQLFYVFPEEKKAFPKWYNFFLLPVVTLVSILTLTPFTFAKVLEFSNGHIQKVLNGWGIFIFGATVVSLIVAGLLILLRKTMSANATEKNQFRLILIGTSITFSLHIAFNLIFPAFLDNPNLIIYGAIFTFPFIIFTAYAILKLRLLGVKVIATEILTFFITVVSLAQLILATTLTERIFRFGIFLLVLGFGILLIRSVRKEVEQRERLEILTKDLEAANAKLKELDAQRAEWLGFASHQVKSPMAVVKGYAQLIMDGTYNPVSEKAKETAGKIKEKVDDLITLVSNYINVSKIDEGKLETPKLNPIDIVKLLRDLVEGEKIVAKKRNLVLTFESLGPSLIIKADEEKIRQVAQNLIDNALKYTEKGFVNVKLEDKGPSVLISITDSGRGMSPTLIGRLFNRYIRDEKTSKEVQGTGLGLFIAKQIVLAHNGEIWAESDGEGKGSRFYFRLPK